ncbi:carbohydrate-binding family 9-like protein [Cyclobacterium marinum]|uniref:carbohydrate-binding family 9-like protein n=1 Tax=Cyclobacterium marinum TaxID=104 RepID=UPI0011F096AA|nr:carbohydrate-binding family 9-like protein [Cyclobacterium marinum]MBI0397912.1 carbohydrate-binding family 9-like protein [Cyclobacterium marinum]|tara:strand:- start:4405 stop:5181 length:777 start_codon:yes stop_codon:yes gene_type:complete
MKAIIFYLSLLTLPLFYSHLNKVTTNPEKSEITSKNEEAEYVVKKLKKDSNPIDANWDKAQWKGIKAISLDYNMGKQPKFLPKVWAKLMYDEENIYGIFKVEDRYVRSIVQEYNGNVSGDSCVEFFFSPDSEKPLSYFNLEINAGGTPLIFYIAKPWDDFTKLGKEDIDQIEIAHSLPEVVDPEISEPTTWTIEYRIPISMLKKHSKVTQPKKGTVWKANFYKTGSRTSNPNFLTWSFVDNPKPNFHLPQFFGTLKFQ